MADDLHHGAFIFEFFELVLLDDLSFDLLDGDDCVLPAAAINNAVPTLGQLSVIAEVIEGYLVVLDEGACFIRDVGTAAAVLLVLDKCLL